MIVVVIRQGMKPNTGQILWWIGTSKGRPACLFLTRRAGAVGQEGSLRCCGIDEQYVDHLEWYRGGGPPSDRRGRQTEESKSDRRADQYLDHP